MSRADRNVQKTPAAIIGQKGKSWLTSHKGLTYWQWMQITLFSSKIVQI